DLQIADAAAYGEAVARERHDHPQRAVADAGHGKGVVLRSLVEQIERGVLRALQLVRRRRQIEQQRVEPPLARIARLFRRERGEVERVEVVDLLRLAVDEELEEIGRASCRERV